MWWPQLEPSIAAALSSSPPVQGVPKRDTPEVLDEILSLARAAARERDETTDQMLKLTRVNEVLLGAVRSLLDERTRGMATSRTLGETVEAMRGGASVFVTDPTPGSTPTWGIGSTKPKP
jgi:hypothetical protein